MDLDINPITAPIASDPIISLPVPLSASSNSFLISFCLEYNPPVN
jgi:hypothetical protein